MACTTILVGKKASLDGSTIIARNEDSGSTEFNPKKFKVVQPADQPRTYTSVLSHVSIPLPKNPMRYTSVPEAVDGHGIWAAAGVNEKNIGMTATETITSNERVLGADPLVEYRPAQGKPGDKDYQPEVVGGIGEEDMVTLVLPYITSARDGVKRLGALLEQYGTYEMNGIAFSDTEEIWWLETIGGHHWIARRVPDEMYVTMPNQLGIDAFDLDDAEGEQRICMASADLREFIKKYRLDKLDGTNELSLGWIDVDPEAGHTIFNPRLAFGSKSDADHVYNTPRSWNMHRVLNPHMEWDQKGAGWLPEDDDIPWCLEPENPISIEDVKYVLSLHYQGTPYDPYGHYGDASLRGKYRPIGINRNGELLVIQLRPYMPQAIQAVEWLAYGSNVFNVMVPLYANTNENPEYLSNTTARVTSESFYWANRLIAALADAHYRECSSHIERYQEAFGAAARALLNRCDDAIIEKNLSYEEAASELALANQKLVDELKVQTDDVLDKVLFDASLGMHNGFSRSDA